MATFDEMLTQVQRVTGLDADHEQEFDRVEFHFASDLSASDPSRRDFLQILGAGLLIAVAANTAEAQVPGKRQGGGPARRGVANLAARVHIDKDGAVTVMTGKVESG